MSYHRFFIAPLLLVVSAAMCGCSSLGLTLYPTGHFLTEQTEQVLLSSAREANVAKELSKGVLPVHYLEPGDVLLIEPVDYESEVRIPADQHVLADGSIDLGGFGRAVVAGLTLEAAEELVEQTIVHSGEDETQINIRLLEGVHRFYVLGEVNSPGTYPLKGHETVLDAILAAGGLTSDASPCKLLLARPTTDRSCRVTLPICYREITQLGDSSTNYQIQPGDRVYVASRSFCEELKCCLATETCERCCKCQSACHDPSLIRTESTYPRIAAERSTSVWKKKPKQTGDDFEEDVLMDDATQNAPELPIRRTSVQDMNAPDEWANRDLNTADLNDAKLETLDTPAGRGHNGVTADGQSLKDQLLDGQLPPVKQPPTIRDSFAE